MYWRGLTNWKVLMSLSGGIFISSGFPFIGNALWIFVDYFWMKHYQKFEDKVSVVMFQAWLIIALWGCIYWGFIV